MENIIFHGELLSTEENLFFLDKISSNISWQTSKIINKSLLKMSLYGSKDFVIEALDSNQKALPWTGELLALKQLVESYTNQRFNACLILSNETTEHFSLPLNTFFESIQEDESSLAFLNLKEHSKLNNSHFSIDHQTGHLIEFTEKITPEEIIYFEGIKDIFQLFFIKIKAD